MYKIDFGNPGLYIGRRVNLLHDGSNPMPEKLESLRALSEAGYLPLSEYIAARRAWLMAELAATERHLQSLVLSWNDRDEAIEYAKDLRNELSGEKAHD